MKPIICLIFIAFLFLGCKKEPCYYNGKILKSGSKGGCYYVSDKGAKVYVDRSACNCN